MRELEWYEKAAEKWIELAEGNNDHGVFLIGSDPDRTGPDHDNFLGIYHTKSKQDRDQIAWSLQDILSDIIEYEVRARLAAADALADALRDAVSADECASWPKVHAALRAYRAARGR